MRPRLHIRPKGHSGFTLIEVMLVIAIVGLVSVGMVGSFRALARTELRNNAVKMAGAIRYLFDRASTTGKMHRLVIDFDEGKYWAEVSDDRFYAASAKETEETREQEAEARLEEEEEEKKREEQREASGESGDSTYDISQYQPEEFKPKRARFNAFKEMALKTAEVKGAAKLAGLFTPRLAEPMATGRGYIYFYALGMTEAAMVYISDKDGETFYTLVVHPLTGRVRVHNKFIEAPVDQQFDDAGNEVLP